MCSQCTAPGRKTVRQLVAAPKGSVDIIDILDKCWRRQCTPAGLPSTCCDSWWSSTCPVRAANGLNSKKRVWNGRGEYGQAFSLDLRFALDCRTGLKVHMQTMSCATLVCSNSSNSRAVSLHDINKNSRKHGRTQKSLEIKWNQCAAHLGLWPRVFREGQWQCVKQRLQDLPSTCFVLTLQSKKADLPDLNNVYSLSMIVSYSILFLILCLHHLLLSSRTSYVYLHL